MKFLTTIYEQIGVSWKFKKAGLFVLLIQLILSTAIGVLAYNYIQGSIGHSSNLLKIIDGYNHDVFQDLLHSEPNGWRMIKTFIAIMVSCYLIVGPFIMGGVLNCYRKSRDSWISFWLGGSHYYKSFLKINLIITALVFLVLSLFLALAVFITNYGMNHFKTEIPTLISWVLLLLSFILLVIILVSISTTAKWIVMSERLLIRKALTKSTREVMSRLIYFLSAGVVFLFLSIGLALAMNLLINMVPESGFLLVLLALVIQVINLFLRVILRHGYYFFIVASRRKSS